MNLGIVSELKSKAWMLGAIGAGAVAAGLSVTLLATKISEHQMATQLHKIERSINDPVDGYVVRLAQCRTNLATVETKLDDQNTAIDALEAKSTAALAATKSKLEDAQEASRRANARAAAMMKPLVGTDSCVRMIEVDERLIRSLKK